MPKTVNIFGFRAEVVQAHFGWFRRSTEPPQPALIWLQGAHFSTVRNFASHAGWAGQAGA